MPKANKQKPVAIPHEPVPPSVAPISRPAFQYKGFQNKFQVPQARSFTGMRRGSR